MQRRNGTAGSGKDTGASSSFHHLIDNLCAWVIDARRPRIANERHIARIESRKIPWIEDPFLFYRAFRDRTPGVLLESARCAPHTGRYSVVAQDPFLILRYESGRIFSESMRIRSSHFCRSPLESEIPLLSCSTLRTSDRVF